MTRLVAGIDISGDQNIGNDKFMGIVIGTQENIYSMIKNLEIERFHNKEIKLTKNRSDLASKLQFNCIENMALCVKIERKRIVNEIIEHLEKKRPVVNRTKIINRYNYHLLQQIREIISAFVVQHNNSLLDVVFGCDSDCVDFLKMNGLKYDSEGFAYKLSDIVAWANNKDQEPRGVYSIDVTKTIKTTLKREFK